MLLTFPKCLKAWRYLMKCSKPHQNHRVKTAMNHAFGKYSRVIPYNPELQCSSDCIQAWSQCITNQSGKQIESFMAHGLLLRKLGYCVYKHLHEYIAHQWPDVLSDVIFANIGLQQCSRVPGSSIFTSQCIDRFKLCNSGLQKLWLYYKLIFNWLPLP